MSAIGNRVNIANINRGAFVNRPANFANANFNVNRFNNPGGFRPYNGGLGWRGPYSGYHSNWVHGYWNGNYYCGWGWKPLRGDGSLGAGPRPGDRDRGVGAGVLPL